MSVLLFSNNSSTTIAGAITNTALTVNLAPGAGAEFPNPGAGQYFVGTFNDAATGLLTEIVWVTARSGDTLTITRAQEGTVALNWNSGDLFSNFWTAGSAAQMLQQGQVPSAALVNYGADTGTADAMVATLSPIVTVLTDGLLVEITPKYANATTTPTLNPSGLGFKNIIRFDGTACVAGDIQPAPAKALLAWDLTTLQFMLLNPAGFDLNQLSTTQGAIVYRNASKWVGLAPGTAGQFLATGGAAANPSWETGVSSAVTSMQVFTSNGTFTVPDNVTKVRVTVVGGGGGGIVEGGGGGGGGGGTAIKTITGLVPAATVTVTVGAGGASQASGGSSSFGAYCSATGGVGGLSVSGGAGGVGSSGDLNIQGGGGSGGGYIGSAIINGTGGSSSLGGGGAGDLDRSGTAGGPYGGGGSGNNAGAAGVVIVEY